MQAVASAFQSAPQKHFLEVYSTTTTPSRWLSSFSLDDRSARHSGCAPAWPRSLADGPGIPSLSETALLEPGGGPGVSSQCEIGPESEEPDGKTCGNAGGESAGKNAMATGESCLPFCLVRVSIPRAVDQRADRGGDTARCKHLGPRRSRSGGGIRAASLPSSPRLFVERRPLIPRVRTN